jgi:fructose-bisphosphate aldolase class 1
MEDTMLKAESVLSLSLRLRHEALHQMRRGSRVVAADISLASNYLRQFASILIADEAKAERDPVRKRELEAEATATWVLR